jgi:hypothetical protein
MRIAPNPRRFTVRSPPRVNVPDAATSMCPVTRRSLSCEGMGEDVKLGVVLPTREAAMTGRPEVEPLLEFAARAEDLGFDSVWAGDAPFARPRFEPLTLLAAVAARTRRVTLGTAILLPALRHPLLLAHAAATVDSVSLGRVVLGVGAGWVKSEFDALGVPFDQRVGASSRRWRSAVASGTPATATNP